MVHLPVRKCFYVAKVGVVLLLVVAILVMVERWRGGKRTASAEVPKDADAKESEYENQVQADEARIVPGLGEGGVAAHLTGRDKELGEESEKKLAINVYLSDRIAYNRSLQDHRNPACQRVVYDAELPSASVIIIFHNEPYSVVLRTIWSVVNSARRDQPWYQRANFVDRETGRTMSLGYAGQDPNSPFVYLKEIILVDDNSTLPELKGKLSHYIRTRLPPDMIRILRLPERVGLTRARLAGARYAAGDALIFLDAHCEGQPDWMRPMLQRIKDAPHAVVMPIIDVIDFKNMYYSVRDPAALFEIGGFTFLGHFTWIDVPEREKKRRGSDIGATWSPTMAGGLFAINREYYWELGAYDEQMAGWGGENLEMSFRIWQCGGTLETIPCSRVGHVFRAFHPYGLPASSDTHGINTARMAEVWMDDYKELFYLHRPDLRNNPKIGDVTHRKVLREKLQCKSFEWYLQNIYKEKFVPVRDAIGYGRFRNEPSGLCLDTLQREGDPVPLGVYPCHPRLQGTQYLSLALDGQLRDEERCVQLQYSRDDDEEKAKGRKLLMVSCNKLTHGQRWSYTSTKQLVHVLTGLCLDSGFEGGADVLCKPCKPSAPTQHWEIDYGEHNGFRISEDKEPSEAEITLQKLRGQRRISRSLMSYAESENATAKVRRHAHKKKKHKRKGKHSKAKRSKPRTKNKFLLEVIRTLMNNTEEHLEMELYCKHRQLYPNNSFVRDIVTILNERNVKVINNGRVFERNRITQLVKDPATKTAKEAKVLEKMEVLRAPNDLGAAPAPKPSPSPPTPLPVPKQTLTPNQVVNTWINKKKKIKHIKPTPAQGVPAASQAYSTGVNPANNPVDAPPSDSPLVDKKIIIEDFVEVKPQAATIKPYKIENVEEFYQQQRALSSKSKKKKKKKKHLRQGEEESTTSLTGAPPPRPEPRKRPRVVTSTSLPEYDEDAMRAESGAQQNSLEENILQAPTVSTETVDPVSKRAGGGENALDDDGGEKEEPEKDASHEEWVAVGDLRNGTRLSRRQQIGADEVASDATTEAPVVESSSPSKDNSTRRKHGSAPLKVVMKSNLTFNLGEEFFKWRSNNDVRDLLGELAIPSNSSRPPPPVHAWVKPASPPHRMMSPVEASTPDPVVPVLRARSVKVPPSANSAQIQTEDGSSSSSESEESPNAIL